MDANSSLVMRGLRIGSGSSVSSGECRPRLATKVEAAWYCRLSVRRFQGWVAKGLIPAALPGTNRWDLKALDHHLDRLSGLTSPHAEDDPFEQWLAEKNARPS